MNFRGGRRRRAEFNIDLMPLIDVVFLLLIFFLITTTFARPKEIEEHKIPVNLPSGVTGSDSQSEDPVTIVVAADGRVRFADEEIEGTDLEARLKALKKDKPDANIMLRGDTDATHGRVVETLDAIKASGFDKVNLIIRKK